MKTFSTASELQRSEFVIEQFGQLQALQTERLREHFRGTLIDRDHRDYESARRVYNAMIDRRPLLIIRCRDVADVVTALDIGRKLGRPVAVRGGGHNGAGFGVCDDGLVIDLSPMRGIFVDPEACTVRVEAGCTQGEVDHATHAFGLAVPAGIVSSTGIAGLTLGGGHGYLTRKFGLTIDNLLEVQMVLADGRVVKANADENPDLFWAVRGGGGNFGIVTSFLFKARAVSRVYGGPIFWPIEELEGALRWYREFILKAPEDLYGFFKLARIPAVPGFPENLHGRMVCGTVWCYIGPQADAEGVFAPIRAVARPLIDAVQWVPFPKLQMLFDPLLPAGLQWYWRGDFFREIPDEVIAVHRKFAQRYPDNLSIVHTYPIDGAASRIPQDATAFSYRDAKWSMVIAGIDSSPANGGLISRWAKDYWEELHPYSLGGAYVNFMMEEGAPRVERTYRENFKRLAELKREYDPTNLFCINQNIKPAN